MKKKTINQLETELQIARDDSSKWYQRYSKLEEEQKIERNNKMYRLEKENSDLQYQLRNMLEIIRLEINPETAKLPFTVEKSERDSNVNRY